MGDGIPYSTLKLKGGYIIDSMVGKGWYIIGKGW